MTSGAKSTTIRVAEHSFVIPVLHSPFSLKPFQDPLITKNGSKQVQYTKFSFFIVKLTCIAMATSNLNRPLKSVLFVKKIWLLDFLYILHATSS